MPYCNFIIGKEYKFLQTIFEQEGLKCCRNLKTLASCYDGFQKFVKIYILLEYVRNKDNGFDKIFDEDLESFYVNEYANWTELNLFEEIAPFKIQGNFEKFATDNGLCIYENNAFSKNWFFHSKCVCDKSIWKRPPNSFR